MVTPNPVRSRAERLGDLLTSWVDRLPPGLRRLLPRSLVGFAILGSFTFLIDLGLLWLIETYVRLPADTPGAPGRTVPVYVAVTFSYAVAFSLNYVLNRTVNFRSHAPVGRQVVLYALVVAADFGITNGVTSGLSAVGLHFLLARVIAGACVAAFTYSGARWIVFRDSLRPAPQPIEGATPSEAKAVRPTTLSD